MDETTLSSRLVVFGIAFVSGAAGLKRNAKVLPFIPISRIEMDGVTLWHPNNPYETIAKCKPSERSI